MSSKLEETFRSDPPSPSDLYKIAMDEYRFQTNLNWVRTQHWFALNIAVPGAAIALLRIATSAGTYLLVAGIFVGGAVACGVAAYALNTQHQYYRAVRDHKRKLEDAMGLGDYAIKTTRGMGAASRRRVSLTTLYGGLMLFLLILNAGGAAYAADRAYEKHTARAIHKSVKKPATSAASRQKPEHKP